MKIKIAPLYGLNCTHRAIDLTTDGNDNFPSPKNFFWNTVLFFRKHSLRPPPPPQFLLYFSRETFPSFSKKEKKSICNDRTTWKHFSRRGRVAQLGKVNFRVSGWPRFLRGRCFFPSSFFHFFYFPPLFFCPVGTIRLSRFGSFWTSARPGRSFFTPTSLRRNFGES